MASLSHTTVDHEKIRRWAEEREALPTSVRGTGGKSEAGILRLDFAANGRNESLEQISWDEFFQKFEESNLAFLYQEHKKNGEGSTFFKFISRDHAKIDNGSETSARAPAQAESSELTAVLNDLMATELKSVELYEKALELGADSGVEHILQKLARPHEDAVAEIENLIFALGGEPESLRH